MNNGIFGLGSSQIFPAINSSRNFLGIPSKIEIPYGFPQGRTPQVNYDNLILIIDTTKEATNVVTLPIQGTVNCTVDWGDGSTDRYTTAGNRTHTYASRGEYTIQIYGSFTALTFSSTTNNRAKIIRCLSFGNIGITSFNFSSCTNLIEVPGILPTGITSLANAFNGCSSFNWPIDLWDVSRITSLASTFASSSFNRDLSSWNTSNVTNMSNTFKDTPRFNGVISNWNTSSVSNMSNMFAGTSVFNQSLAGWDVRKCSNFSSIFSYAAAFNSSVSGWELGTDTSVATGTVDLSYMCTFGAFNHPSINTWNTTKVGTLDSTFRQCVFNQSLSNWDTSNVTNMTATFYLNSVFNQSIGNWNVGKSISFANMFQGTPFNQSLSGWNIGANIASGATIVMYSMFESSPFNQPLNMWDVSKVNNFSSMFRNNTNFNSSLSGWNIGGNSAVTSISMDSMFSNTSAFNSSVANWDFKKPTTASDMFYNTASFNHSSITGWNTSGITNMGNMFYNNRVFNQPIGSWNTSNVTSMNNMFNFCTAFNQSLNSWNVGKVTSFVGMFVSTPINQDFEAWNIGANVASGTSINMSYMFNKATSFNKNINNWDVSKVSNFSSMFEQASAFNQPLSGWNIGGSASITSINMSYMFSQATNFNQSLNSWNVGKVTNFLSMLRSSNFNQPLSGWNIGANTPSGVSISMNGMFFANSVFNQNINSWNMSKVNDTAFMFHAAYSYNQPMASWDVSKVNNFASMLLGTPINQDLSSWNISGINTTAGLDSFMSTVTTFSTTNYNNLLIGWESRKSSCRNDLRPNFGSSKYTASGSAAAAARASLIAYGWTITDGGSVIMAPDPPTAVTGTGGDAEASLSWTAPIYNNGSSITDYAIQYSSNSGSSWTLYNDGISTSISGTITGLVNDQPYIFRVAAVNVSGTGAYSQNSNEVIPSQP